MKNILTICLAAAVVLACALAVGATDSGPDTVSFPSSRGEITFDHATHSGVTRECETCHHEGLDSAKCTGCHGKLEGVIDAKKAFHKQCKGCHKMQNGPTGCSDCHVKP